MLRDTITLSPVHFEETKTCVYGKNFISNGHWIIKTTAVHEANLKQNFEPELLRNNIHIMSKDDTIEEVVARHQMDEPPLPCEISDVSYLNAQFLYVDETKLISIHKNYTPLVNQITEDQDKLTCNSKVLTLLDQNDVVIMALSIYDIKDNRPAISEAIRKAIS